ncbi:MAG: bifunctional hydroxymethylpyrimidine kinase/phosphomethylpyrimidine kinase [Treponema sp.]|nr:bifunctional hydroxymethylpyrimidine kinase/phosphomethylpyrimidine kinase [Treponema sp.]
MHTALTIAGSDCSGGAGIQADLKTMLAHHVYGMSAITALTAQNTTGVQGIMEVTPEFLGQQLDSICTDIFPDAVKIGMVSSAALIAVIATKIDYYALKNIVVDPVMIASTGSRLLSDAALSVLQQRLLPFATVITPNIPEAEVLADMKVLTKQDMLVAAHKIAHLFPHTAVLLKGGHAISDANDLLIEKDEEIWFCGARIHNPNTHGTGCTLSSAITSNLAKGYSLKDSVQRAKNYISGALAAGLDLGKGSGPLDHGFGIKE